jgi:hypothetical protein
MKSTTFKAAFSILLLVIAVPALAQRRGHPPLGQRGGFLIQTDADFGGETLATVEFEDDYSQDIRAGQGFSLSIGGWFRPIETSSLEIQTSLGYKYETTIATNADISFSRSLLQFEALYRWPNGVFVGGGLMRHMGPKLSGDDFFGDVEFDDANGFNVEAGWRWISLHYTKIDYAIDDLDVRGISGNSIGIRFTWRPGERWF